MESTPETKESFREPLASQSMDGNAMPLPTWQQLPDGVAGAVARGNAIRDQARASETHQSFPQEQAPVEVGLKNHFVPKPQAPCVNAPPCV